MRTPKEYSDNIKPNVIMKGDNTMNKTSDIKKEESLEMTEIVVTEIGVIFEEQYLAVIFTCVDNRLLENCDDYYEFEQSPSYDALMNALDKFEEHPYYYGIYTGETDRDQNISAILREPEIEEMERIWSLNGHFEDDDLPVRYLMADIWDERDNA